MESHFVHPQTDIIHAYWADRLSCFAGQLLDPGTHLATDTTADPYRIQIVQCGQSTVFRFHPDVLESVQSALPGYQQNEEIPCDWPEPGWTPTPTEKVYYLDPQKFQPVEHSGVRPLTESDSLALTDLHRDCSPEDQQLSEVNIDHPAVFGCFLNDNLAAVASLIFQGDEIADVGVLTHPAYRGQGLGKAVVSAVCRWGLEHDRILQYWRLCTNRPSVKLADRLNFTLYATHQILRYTGLPPT